MKKEIIRREPSIHLTRSNLRILLKEWYDFSEYADDHIYEMVEFLMKNGKNLSQDSRLVLVSNNKVEKEVNKKISNDKSDYLLMSNIIYNIRKQRKHKGIKPIDTQSNEYIALKKLTKAVNIFCNDFNLSKREGYIFYVNKGLDKISSYRGYISKLEQMVESISVEYETNDLIQNHKLKEEADRAHTYYIQKVAKRTGISENYKDRPIQYINFIKLCEISRKYNVTYIDYIESQFSELEWTGTYPDIFQLVNDKSIERLNKYMYKRDKTKISINKTNSDNRLTNILKRIKDGNYNDEQ